jgi:nucleotide-binding universal stress UspA family protein
MKEPSVPTILVGVDDSDRSLDAVALARQLALASGATVLVAAAFPYDDRPSPVSNRDLRRELELGAKRTVQRACTLLEDLSPDRLQTRTIARHSAAHALHDIAEHAGAALIVVGSSHTGLAGRVLPGSTAERLLHGAPCPVAVAPRDHRTGHRALTRIGAAYDGSAEAQAALGAAAAIAAATGADLAVIRVMEPLVFTGPTLAPASLYLTARDQSRDALREDLDNAIHDLPAGVHADAVLLEGDPPSKLAAETERLDLVVTGSRGYGPLHAVLAGGFAGRLLREAACPVIVVPRGVESPVGALFAQAVSHR